MDEQPETHKVGKAAGNRGKGRPKGSVNKYTALLKDDILAAAHAAHPQGRVGYLTQQAQENPGPFLTLLGKVLPMTVEGTGPGGALNVIISARDADL